MGLVSTWLNGIGLSSAVPTFQAAGIVTPAALAELDVAHFEALGISDPDDRRKLFYLVQRIKMAVNKDRKGTEHSVEEQIDAVISGTVVMQEEKKEDSSKTQTKMKSTPEKKKSKTSTLKTPVRRSNRLASKEENADGEEVSSNPSISRKPSASRPESPTKASQPRPMSPTKTVSTPQKTDAVASRQLLPSKARVEERQEDEGNNSSEEEKHISHAKRTTRKTVSRTAASKRASAVVNAREEQDGAEATSAPPVKNSTAHRTSGLKKPIPVSAAAEPKNQKSSKLQNPGKSIRTGKPLSAIPSDEVAPSSPLTHHLASDLEDKASAPVQGRHRRRSSAGSQESNTQEPMDEGSDDQGSTHSGSTLSTASSRRSQGNIVVAKPGTQRLSLAPSDASAVSNSWNRRKSLDPVSKSSIKSVPFIQGGTQTESWSTQVAHLREDNNAEYELFRSEEQELYEFDMRIRVIVRKRPVSNAEASLSGGIDVIHPLDYGDYGKVLVYQPKTRVDLTKEIETIPFAYDNVFDEKSTNLEIYQRSLRNLIQPFFRGQQATVFAYGQTGSGYVMHNHGSDARRTKTSHL
jgi:hypothetical protein